jgi:hypothetical protein
MVTDLDSCGEVQSNQNVIKFENKKQIKQLQRKCVSPPPLPLPSYWQRHSTELKMHLSSSKHRIRVLKRYASVHRAVSGSVSCYNEIMEGREDSCPLHIISLKPSILIKVISIKRHHQQPK